MKWDAWRGGLDGKPTMHEKHLLHYLGRRVDLHKMVAVDGVDCFHTHPAHAIRIILWGGYTEQLEDGTEKTWRPGSIGLVPPDLCHRISSILNTRNSYSLWLRGRKCAPIELRGKGWGIVAFKGTRKKRLSGGWSRQVRKREERTRREVKRGIERRSNEAKWIEDSKMRKEREAKEEAMLENAFVLVAGLAALIRGDAQLLVQNDIRTGHHIVTFKRLRDDPVAAATDEGKD